MNLVMSEAKAVIGRAVEECQQSWLLSRHDIQIILASIMGDIAVSGRPTTNAADKCQQCGFYLIASETACPMCGTCR